MFCLCLAESIGMEFDAGTFQQALLIQYQGAVDKDARARGEQYVRFFTENPEVISVAFLFFSSFFFFFFFFSLF